MAEGGTVQLVFASDDEMVRFVSWSESSRIPAAVGTAAREVEATLIARGWTRHGYIAQDWCAPGLIYDVSHGCLPPDDPRVIAGRWTCTCGFETDRLAHAEGHAQAAEGGAQLANPGPHAITEVERRGPEPREWGEGRG